MSCVQPRYFPWIRNHRNEVVPCSCGVCLSCKVDRISVWSLRLQIEYIKKCSAFVTLTYDDNHLPLNTDSYIDSGLSFSPSDCHPVLVRSHLSSYIDRLRHMIKYYKLDNDFCSPDFSYFACGEYGDNNTERCHFHVLFFGLDYEYCKKMFQKYWSFGHVKVLPVLRGGIRYVLKYLEKKVNGELADSLYFDNGLTPPFVSMSKGIGTELYFSQRDYISTLGVMKINNRFIPCPSYYKNKLLNFCDSTIDEIDKRDIMRMKDIRTDMSKLGFTSFVSYVRWKSKNRELELLARSHNYCQPATDFTKRVPSLSHYEILKLVDSALSWD